jgi:acetyl esterase/lipase
MPPGSCGGSLYLWIDENKLQLNPEIHVTRETPPTFLLQAEDDQVDDVNQSLVYYIALKNAAAPVELNLYAHGGHAFGLRRTKPPITVRADLKIQDRVQLKEFRKWRSKELVRKLPPRVRQSGSLARYGSIRFSRHPIRHWFKAPA